VKKTIFLILIAFLFSVIARLFWVYEFSSNESFKFNNEFIINTNDGFFYAEGARDILKGYHQEYDLSPVYSAPSKLTAFLVEILPFSFESIIFYLPIFLSSLIVIPLILLGRTFNKIEFGFISALIASITWSYYNRTMVGYYDTDMLNIVFPTFLLWSLVLALRTKEEKYLLFTGLEIIAYRWWYPQSYALEFAFFLLILFYTIYLLIKKEDYKYELKLITMMLFAMVYLDTLLRVLTVILLYFGFKKNIFKNYLFYLFSLIILIFIFTGGLTPIWEKLENYLFQKEILSIGEDLKLHFYTTMQTIKETAKISFQEFAIRISGHVISFVFAFLGLILLIVKHRSFLLILPLLGLGLLSYGIPYLIPSGGLRFSIYAVPVFALGLGYFIYEFARLISNNIKDKKTSFISFYFILFLFTSLVLYPNLKHIIEYKIPTEVRNSEAKVLDELKNIASREDYVISWWDFGCPIRYYSDTKVLVDHGKHGGSVSFPISYIFTNPQNISAKMARLDVEYTEKAFRTMPIDVTNFREDRKGVIPNITLMTKDYGFKNTNDFLDSLNSNIILPKKSRDIYFYLPYKMLSLYSTMELFSNLDLMTGEKRKSSFFFESTSFKQNEKLIDLGSNVKIIKDKALLQIAKSTFPIKRFITTAYTKDKKFKKKISNIYPNGKYTIIYMSSYKKYLVLEEKVYNSLFIQHFVLENYDSRFYEPVILTPRAKIFKLRI